MKSPIVGIHHATFVTENLERSLDFYTGILALECDPSRPEMAFEGAWLNLAAPQQIHLMQLPNPDLHTDRPTHGGRDKHVAFLVNDLEWIKARLMNEGIAFTESRSGRKALFVRDPDQNALELIQSESP